MMSAAAPSISTMPVVRAGFLPLVDCAPLVIAKERGFDRQQGFILELDREVSWANIRDRVDIGALDCAHMLAPMPLAATLSIGRATHPIIAPMTMSLNGNAITVSNGLFQEMASADPVALASGGFAAARAMAAVIARRRQIGAQPLTLGMVYPFSSHNYDLRCWLASAGIDPDADVNLIVVPPSLLTASLEQRRVDGFCVGAPWNSVAVSEGHGVIVTTKNELWPASLEKVLGMREDWAERNFELVAAIIRSLIDAARWLDEPENRPEAARLLSASVYIGIDQNILSHPLTGRMALGGGDTRTLDDMILFQRDGANVPRASDAIWFLAQMIRWGHVRTPFAIQDLSTRVYRADLYLAAIGSVEKDAQQLSSLYCGEVFDASKPLEYLNRLGVRWPGADLASFAPLNS